MADIYNILIIGKKNQNCDLLNRLLITYGMKTPLVKKVVGTESKNIMQRESLLYQEVPAKAKVNQLLLLQDT